MTGNVELDAKDIAMPYKNPWYGSFSSSGSNSTLG